jgi:tetratricopeptide (TPR) repeat protein
MEPSRSLEVATEETGNSEYNQRMQLGIPVFLLVLILPVSSWAQGASKSSLMTATERGVALAESGQCSQALPILKRSIRTTSDRDLRKRIGLDGVHCAMTHGEEYDALPFLEVLDREFPDDPEVLYVSTHAFSDLALQASQSLARNAPFSYQVHLLNAEALETQGKWTEAADEYRKILDINPMLPGIHARLGRALLSKPQPSAEDVAEAKKDFEQELVIDPRNANAEYVLGALAAQSGDSSAAIEHYTRATRLDKGFAEAYLGLGSALVAAKRFTEAIPPLQAYEKFAPESPTGHYQLALAYAGAGRRDDANREAALQRETAASLEKVKRRVAEGLEQQTDPQTTDSGSNAPK